jgi:hypothetical protein
LTSSGQFNLIGPKPSAFLPSKRGRETSVFRHGSEPSGALWAIADAFIGGRRVHAAAIVKTRDVRATNCEVVANEPPQRHAAIRNWPWLEDDPEEQKALQKEIAAQISSKATLVHP